MVHPCGCRGEVDGVNQCLDAMTSGRSCRHPEQRARHVGFACSNPGCRSRSHGRSQGQSRRQSRSRPELDETRARPGEDRRTTSSRARNGRRNDLWNVMTNEERMPISSSWGQQTRANRDQEIRRATNLSPNNRADRDRNDWLYYDPARPEVRSYSSLRNSTFGDRPPSFSHRDTRGNAGISDWAAYSPRSERYIRSDGRRGHYPTTYASKIAWDSDSE